MSEEMKLKDVAEIKPDHYIVFDKRESLYESVVKDGFTFSFIGLCIWVSQGSTFWTFLSGLIFLLFIYIRLSSVFTQRFKKFTTKEQAVAWLNSQDG